MMIAEKSLETLYYLFPFIPSTIQSFSVGEFILEIKFPYVLPDLQWKMFL